MNNPTKLATFLALLGLVLSTSGQAFSSIALDNDLCQFNSCQNKTMNSQAVIDFCTKQSGVIYARCCLINTTTTTMATTTASMNAPAVSGKSEQQYIIGLDLSNCQIDSLSKALDTFDRKLYQHVEIFDFSDNKNVTECPDEAYRGFLKLDFLYKPLNCSCPGQNHSWAHTSANECSGLTPVCGTSFPNSNCTDTSECSEDGPGNIKCLCKNDHHGYKCLEKGKFPTLTFTIVICVGTLALSAFLWQTQRRHVKRD